MDRRCVTCAGRNPDCVVCDGRGIVAALEVPGTVYLLHFTVAVAHARHYLGWTAGEVDARVDQHRRGAGSPLVGAAVAGGAAILVVRTWAAVGRSFERRLKRASNLARHCPHCRAESLARAAAGMRRLRKNRKGSALLQNSSD
jgi:hypothetical protein